MHLQHAPYKRRGKIPFGVQRGTYGLTAEEKMRRRWKEWSSAGSNGSGTPALAAAAAEPSYQVRGWAPGRIVRCTCLVQEHGQMQLAGTAASALAAANSSMAVVFLCIRGVVCMATAGVCQ
jgi:hypothetical protein